ncbi:MAG TPA: efflux RND transporter periplasmic adaptor subunit [Geminicoccaceae bacterium]|nr:efflux RND transporter periplasmic adaptor subunit [Geminicoccaceae bacterium]
MKRSYLIAGGLAVALAAWVASGRLDLLSGAPEPTAGPPAAATAAPHQDFTVRVRETTARPVEREVVANGRTAAARRVELRAEVMGRVVEVLAERGARVAAGDLLVRLDPRDRQARLTQAEAALRQREIEYEAGRTLGQRGFQAETEVARRLAELEQARAAVEAARLELAHTEIRAPFAGVLDQRPAEIGHFLDRGDHLATLLEIDPLVIVGDVAEIEAAGLRVGMPGAATLVTGDRVAGRVRYLSSEADAATRTFRIELEVANPDARLPAGVSAILRLPLEPVPAHEVSSALLVLDDAGRLGVQAVDETGIVRFHPASIVRAGTDAVWLAGLPERLRIITVGQGFVRAGQKVAAVAEPAATAERAPIAEPPS